MAMHTCVGDNRCGTKRALGGVVFFVEFNLRAAIGAGNRTKIFDHGVVQAGRYGRAIIQFGNAARCAQIRINLNFVATMIAHQIPLAGRKP